MLHESYKSLKLAATHHPEVHFPSVDTILFVNQFPYVYNLLRVSVFRCVRKIVKSVS